jgi:hypothetical protein
MDIGGDGERQKGGRRPNKVDAEIDDEVMMHIFNMYAVHTAAFMDFGFGCGRPVEDNGHG